MLSLLRFEILLGQGLKASNPGFCPFDSIPNLLKQLLWKAPRQLGFDFLKPIRDQTRQSLEELLHLFSHTKRCRGGLPMPGKDLYPPIVSVLARNSHGHADLLRG